MIFLNEIDTEKLQEFAQIKINVTPHKTISLVIPRISN